VYLIKITTVSPFVLFMWLQYNLDENKKSLQLFCMSVFQITKDID